MPRAKHNQTRKEEKRRVGQRREGRGEEGSKELEKGEEREEVLSFF